MNALEELSERVYEAKQKKYPNVPRHALSRHRYTANSANELTDCVLTWLSVKGHYCSRIQCQGQYQPKLGIFTPSTVRRGIGDILAIVSGQTIMIEIKYGRDQQSKYQKQTELDVKQSGGVYLTVRSFDGFIYWYKKFTAENLARGEGSKLFD
jgi:hypothetical protein